MIPANTIMQITEPFLDCVGLFLTIGRVLNVVHVDEDRRMWFDFELSDACDITTRTGMVITVPDDWMEYCDTRQQWAERKRRSLYQQVTHQ